MSGSRYEDRDPLIPSDAQSLHPGSQSRWRSTSAFLLLPAVAVATLMAAAKFGGSTALRGHVSSSMQKDQEFVVQQQFDCEAALGNFHRAWSAAKKKWCCTNDLKGCDGGTAPSFSAGEGMMWKHVLTDDYWSWEVVPAELDSEFDCTAALNNFHRAWSPAKKQYCCTRQLTGCEGPTSPSISAGEGLTWTHVETIGYWSWEAVPEVKKAPFDCEAALGNFHRAWSPVMKKYCCTKEQKGCEGTEEPSVFAGAGMMWKLVQTDGYWSWQVVHAPSLLAFPLAVHETVVAPAVHETVVAQAVHETAVAPRAQETVIHPLHETVKLTLLEPDVTKICCQHPFGDDCCFLDDEKFCWDTPEEAMPACCSARTAATSPQMWKNDDLSASESLRQFFEERGREGLNVKLTDHPDGELEIAWTRGELWFGVWDSSCEGYHWHDQVSTANLLQKQNTLYDPTNPLLGREPGLFVQFNHSFTAAGFSECLVGPVFEDCQKIKPCINTTTTTTVDCWSPSLPPAKLEYCCANWNIGCPTSTVTSITTATRTATTVTATTVTATTVTATTVTATTVTVDCWQTPLPASLNDYCCHHWSIGCPTTPPPPKSCNLWGDPHVLTFDGSRFVYYREGDFWILKSPTLNIQGRFQATNWTKANDHTDFSSMTGIVITGSLIENHLIEVYPTDFDGQIKCDGNPVLGGFGSMLCGNAKVSYDSAGELVDDAMASLPHRVVHLTLPAGVILQVNRWANFMNAKIILPFSMAYTVDGVCGNYNNDEADDSGRQIHERWGNGVSKEECLFPSHIPLYVPTAAIPEKKCLPEKRLQAAEICRKQMAKSSGWAFAECMGDVCVEGRLPSELQTFDCDEGLATFKFGWSQEKKDSCCKNEKKGCIV